MQKRCWAAFAEHLKILADKAFPQLQMMQKNNLPSTTTYIGQISNHQIAFGVWQKCPKILDEAVSATLEL